MRIALVNDVMAAVEAMRRVVLSTQEHQIAWIAHDGREALELCARDTPDLILMDLIMPGMDGVEATRRIMAHNPCAIVVVTANVTSRSSKVFEAMGAGALDAVNTPVLESTGAFDGATALLGKIETIRRLIGADRLQNQPASAQPVARHRTQHCNYLIGIGASADGPTALAKVLAHLPAHFPAPVIIVQHVDAHFAGRRRAASCAPSLPCSMSNRLILRDAKFATIRTRRSAAAAGICWPAKAIAHKQAPFYWLVRTTTSCLRVPPGSFMPPSQRTAPAVRPSTFSSRARIGSGRAT